MDEVSCCVTKTNEDCWADLKKRYCRTNHISNNSCSKRISQILNAKLSLTSNFLCAFKVLILSFHLYFHLLFSSRGQHLLNFLVTWTTWLYDELLNTLFHIHNILFHSVSFLNRQRTLYGPYCLRTSLTLSIK